MFFRCNTCKRPYRYRPDHCHQCGGYTILPIPFSCETVEWAAPRAPPISLICADYASDNFCLSIVRGLFSVTSRFRSVERNRSRPRLAASRARSASLRPTKTGCARFACCPLLFYFMRIVHRTNFAAASFGDSFRPLHHERAAHVADFPRRARFDGIFACGVVGT